MLRHITARCGEKIERAGAHPAIMLLRDAERKPEAQGAASAAIRVDAFDLNSAPMVQLDGNGRVLRVNQALVRETGIAAESLLGSTLVELSQNSDPQIAKMLIPRLQGGAPAILPRPRNDSSLAGELAQWQRTDGSPPWPL